MIRGVAQEENFEATETAAANLCALVFNNSEGHRRFSMSIDDLVALLGTNAYAARATSTLAEECGWVRVVGNAVQLTAAGIYVAKEMLDLPR